MIQELKDIPNTLVAFRATGESTPREFESIVVPAVAELVKRTNKINYLLIPDSPRFNLTFGEWLKHSMETLNEVDHWNRSAIIDNNEGTNDRFKSVPGEFRVFRTEELEEAIKWVGEQEHRHPVQVFAEEGEAED